MLGTSLQLLLTKSSNCLKQGLPLLGTLDAHFFQVSWHRKNSHAQPWSQGSVANTSVSVRVRGSSSIVSSNSLVSICSSKSPSTPFFAKAWAVCMRQTTTSALNQINIFAPLSLTCPSTTASGCSGVAVKRVCVHVPRNSPGWLELGWRSTPQLALQTTFSVGEASAFPTALEEHLCLERCWTAARCQTLVHALR